jgi:hypothetical protein
VRGNGSGSGRAVYPWPPQSQLNKTFNSVVCTSKQDLEFGANHLIPLANFMRIQTTELEMEVISFPFWIWNFHPNSIPR